MINFNLDPELFIIVKGIKVGRLSDMNWPCGAIASRITLEGIEYERAFDKRSFLEGALISTTYISDKGRKVIIENI